jgi:hypothetical protein
MPTTPGTPPSTPAQPAGRAQRPRRDRYGRPMSKWSAATGRIRRHATGILGGRIGGVGASPGVASPGVAGPGARTSGARAALAEDSPIPAPRPHPGALRSDDTVRMPRQAAAPAESDAGAAIGRSNGAVPSALTERTVNLRLPAARPPLVAAPPAHRVGRFLRALDRRFLPPVGGALAGLGRRSLWGRVVATTGAVACVALTVVAVYAATRPATATPKSPGIHVGVSAGDVISQYRATRQSNLDAAVAADAPLGAPTSRYALVSFRSYLQPEQLAPLLAGAEPAEVFLRAPRAGVVEAPVRVIPDDVVKAITSHAQDVDGAAADLQTKIDQMGQSADENALKDRYRLSLSADLVEKAAYTEECTCAFGAVVHGSLQALQVLSGRDGIRVVDLVPLTPDVSQDTFMPVLPEQTDIAYPPPLEDVQPR